MDSPLHEKRICQKCKKEYSITLTDLDFVAIFDKDYLIIKELFKAMLVLTGSRQY